MTDSHDELLGIAKDLEQLADRGREPEIREPLERLRQAAEEAGKAWSRSWLGYHANVYTGDFQPPDPRAQFNPKVGLNRLSLQLYGSWREYRSQEVEEAIFRLAGNPDMKPAFVLNDKASSEFRSARFTLLSILDLELNKSSSPLLSELKGKVDNLSLMTYSELVRSWQPEKVPGGDRLAISQGIRTPPHLSIRAKVVAT